MRSWNHCESIVNFFFFISTNEHLVFSNVVIKHNFQPWFELKTMCCLLQIWEKLIYLYKHNYAVMSSSFYPFFCNANLFFCANWSTRSSLIYLLSSISIEVCFDDFFIFISLFLCESKCWMSLLLVNYDHTAFFRNTSILLLLILN